VSLHVQKELATREFLQSSWEVGLDAFVWTVNELREMEAYASSGVQGIMSDFPELFWRLEKR
jgi:hypothetical protein